jgi:hypothetical protein
MGHLGCNQLASQSGCTGIPLFLSQVALQDRVRGPLAELRFEDRR